MPTPQIESWRQKLHELAVKISMSNRNYQKLQDFVQSLLSSQKSEIVEMVEGMKTEEPTLCGNCNLNGDLCSRCSKNRGYNQALKDLLTKIKE